jgi:hypothetical protein
MEIKIIPREKWNPILESLSDLTNDLRRLPKQTPWTKWEIKERKARAEEERKKRLDPRYNSVSGSIIDKRKRKHDVVPRPLARTRQIEYDRKRGAYNTKTYLNENTDTHLEEE